MAGEMEGSGACYLAAFAGADKGGHLRAGETGPRLVAQIAQKTRLRAGDL